jgi:Bifunctional DNA primase/polymerase, N-terminal
MGEQPGLLATNPIPEKGARVNTPKGAHVKNNTRSAPRSATPFATGALYYLRTDFSSVIPIHRPRSSKDRGKGPLVKGHHGWEGAYPTADEVRDWEHDFPKANIAIRLMAGVFGVDVDAYEPKPGAETLAKLENDLGPLPSAPTSTSRWPEDQVSGIRLFRVPEGLAWKSVPWCEAGIEFISWHNRYVICPPSVHSSGRRYRWVRDGQLLRGGLSLDVLPWLPARWVEFCRADRNGPVAGKPPAEGARAWLEAHGRGEMCDYMSGKAERALAEIDGGSAHEAAKYWSLMLCNAIAEGHPGGNRALARLRDAFYAEVNGRTGKDRRGMGTLRGEWQSLLDGAVTLANKNGVSSEDACGELPGKGFRP